MQYKFKLEKLMFSESSSIIGGDRAVERVGGAACAIAIASSFVPAFWGLAAASGLVCLAAGNYEYYYNGW